MTKKQSVDKSRIDKTQIIVAIVGALALIIVGYWQFGTRSTQPVKPGDVPVEYVGRVLDEKASGIRGAKISLDFQGAPPIVYTDGEGIYRFVINAKGDSLPGRIWVEAEGYEKYDRNITLILNNPNIEDIRLVSLR